MTQGCPLVQERLLSHWQNDLVSTVSEKQATCHFLATVS